MVPEARLRLCKVFHVGGGGVHLRPLVAASQSRPGLWGAQRGCVCRAQGVGRRGEAGLRELAFGRNLSLLPQDAFTVKIAFL